MVRRSDASMAALLLCQRVVDRGVEPLRASEYWPLMEAVGDPASLLGLAASDIARVAPASAASSDRIATLLAGATAVAFELEALEQAGIAAVSPVDAAYPSVLVDRLGAGAPPVLYMAGPASLLTARSFGIVGSSTADVEVAEQAAGAAVLAGYPVATGGADDVDSAATRAALDASGRAVSVLAGDLARRIREPATRRAVIAGSACLCTPYAPATAPSVARAIGRNKVLYALCDSTLVASADLEAGITWAGAAEALSRALGEVIAWHSSSTGPGNRGLIDRGARPVQTISEIFPLRPPGHLTI